MIRIRNASNGVARRSKGGAPGPPFSERPAAPDHLAFSPNVLRAVGYIRVSTNEQADSGVGLAAQTAAIQAECARRGWQLVEIYRDTASGKSLDRRPAFAKALEALAAGQASTLVVAKLDRFARSLKDFANLIDRFQHEKWALVALDIGIDTSTPSGEAMMGVMAVFAQLERRLIGQRTKEGLAIVRQRGPAPGKKAIGRPRTIDPKVSGRIERRRANGWTLAKIATAEGLAISSVQAVLNRV